MLEKHVRSILEIRKISNSVSETFEHCDTINGNLTSHGDHIAIDSNEVLGELGTLFLEGVTKSNKIIWASIQDRSGL